MVHPVTKDADAGLLRGMRRIRAVEEAIAARYAEQKMRCPTHLSIGQEGVAVGVCAALEPEDTAVSGHRAHAHYLAKGGNLPAMIAELYGKETGCSRGKGGSMHLVDESVGFMGSTAIVGGTVPVGVGLALAAKLEGTAALAVVFVGDAVAETGVFSESLNFAAVKRLPVLFVCENNLYSVYSGLSVRQPEGRRIDRLAEALGVPAAAGDGNDARAVRGLTREAVRTIREGRGPRFLEFATYRWREHCGPHYDNDIGYRSPAEFEGWKDRDPIAVLEAALLGEDRIAPADLVEMDRAIEAEIGEAFAFAEASDFPPPSEAFSHLYAAAT